MSMIRLKVFTAQAPNGATIYRLLGEDGRNSIELGGKNAQQVDALEILLPTEWEKMTCTLTAVPIGGTPVAVILSENGVTTVSSALTGASGELCIDATDGEIHAYTSGLRYSVYGHPNPAQDTDPPAPSVWEQFVAQVAEYAAEAKAAAEKAAGASGGGTDSNFAWLPSVSADGTLTWRKSDSETAPEAVIIMGPAGERGRDGEQGPAGQSGQDGAVGPQGPQGDQGIPGVAGKDGATGEKGEKGDIGETGPQGPAGSDGKPGAKGDKGDTGLTGPQGLKGDKGETGAAGADGVDGYSPVRGTDYWTNDDIAAIKAYVDSAILGGTW